MAWKLVNPNITNDPSYLEPRLSNDESNISNNTTSLAQKATQASVDKNTQRIGDHGFNVKDYQCSDGQYVQGDGVHDDTTGIQAAINDAISKTAVLFFPSGTFKTTQTLVINNSLRIVGAYETGWSGRGTIIKYYGSSDAFHCEVANPQLGVNEIFGGKFESIRIDSGDGNGNYGVKVSGSSQINFIDCQFDNGFQVGLYLNCLTIANIERCTFSDNKIGLQFAHDLSASSQNMAVNVRGCDFWQNSIAHIKMNYGVNINITENWMEYSPIGILIDNNTPYRTELTNVCIERNVITCQDNTNYPNSKAIKIIATTNTIDMQIFNLTIENNLLYNNTTDYNILIDMTGSNANSYCKGHIIRNLIWGAQTSCINSVGTPYTYKTIFSITNNDYRNGYLGASQTGITGDIQRTGVMVSQPASVATDITTLKNDFNTLLTAIKNAGFMNQSQ